MQREPVPTPGRVVVKALVGRAADRRVVDLGESAPIAAFRRQACVPDARVDLIERRMARHRRLRPLDLAAEDRGAPLRQDHLRFELAEQLDQAGDDPGPAGLVAGADAGAVVAVEIFVQQ